MVDVRESVPQLGTPVQAIGAASPGLWEVSTASCLVTSSASTPRSRRSWLRRGDATVTPEPVTQGHTVRLGRRAPLSSLISRHITEYSGHSVGNTHRASSRPVSNSIRDGSSPSVSSPPTPPGDRLREFIDLDESRALFAHHALHVAGEFHDLRIAPSPVTMQLVHGCDGVGDGCPMGWSVPGATVRSARHPGRTTWAG